MTVADKISTPESEKSMRIPVFVSCPSKRNISEEQENIRAGIIKILNQVELEQRALGRSDYPDGLPLREVLVIGRHCAGGIILGFETMRVCTGIRRSSGKAFDEPEMIPTPWNHLEAGILYGLGLPLLVFRETVKDVKGHNRNWVKGGIFDEGVSDVFVRDMPTEAEAKVDHPELKHVFLKWHARVAARYYGTSAPL